MMGKHRTGMSVEAVTRAARSSQYMADVILDGRRYVGTAYLASYRMWRRNREAEIRLHSPWRKP